MIETEDGEHSVIPPFSVLGVAAEPYMSHDRRARCNLVMYCHGNFGPAKILVRGTKIPGKSVPPDQNILKNLVRIWKKGSGLDFAREPSLAKPDPSALRARVWLRQTSASQAYFAV